MINKERGKSWQKLGQITATLASRFFLVAGVFMSFGRMMVSSSFELVDLQYKIAKFSSMNSSMSNGTVNQTMNTAISLTQSSINFFQWGIAFLSIGVGLTGSSLMAWYIGHRMRCSK